MAKYKFFPAESRGYFNHGWLKTYHSFSFAHYFDIERMNFGMLRVLNDDEVVGGEGFGAHPHDNMEIISIVLEGALAHKDNIGSSGVISAGEVQHMSAGTGILHSEFNADKDDAVRFLQIWLIPKKMNVSPVYHQQRFELKDRINKFQIIVAPEEMRVAGALPINQDAYLSMIRLEENWSLSYRVKTKDCGVFVFLLEGEVTVNDYRLEYRDSLGIEGTDTITIKAHNTGDLLLIEVPMDS